MRGRVTKDRPIRGPITCDISRALLGSLAVTRTPRFPQLSHTHKRTVPRDGLPQAKEDFLLPSPLHTLSGPALNGLSAGITRPGAIGPAGAKNPGSLAVTGKTTPEAMLPVLMALRTHPKVRGYTAGKRRPGKTDGHAVHTAATIGLPQHRLQCRDTKEELRHCRKVSKTPTWVPRTRLQVAYPAASPGQRISACPRNSKWQSPATTLGGLETFSSGARDASRSVGERSSPSASPPRAWRL